jgi:hypothetical protein
MHIHGSGMNPRAAGLYSAAGAEKAAAAQRAAEVRRKLNKGAQEIDGAASSESLLIGQWTDSRHSQIQSEDQYHSSASGRNPDFG